MCITFIESVDCYIIVGIRKQIDFVALAGIDENENLYNQKILLEEVL